MLLRGLRWGLAGALVAWTLIRLLGLDRVWPVVPLFALTPWVAALALLAAAVGAVLRWRLFALVCAASGLVLAVAIAPRVVPNRAPEDARGVRLRVLAANVGGVPTHRARARRRRCAAGASTSLSLVELPPEVGRAPTTPAGIGDAAALPACCGRGRASAAPGCTRASRCASRPAPEGTRFAVSAASAGARGARRRSSSTPSTCAPPPAPGADGRLAP